MREVEQDYIGEMTPGQEAALLKAMQEKLQELEQKHNESEKLLCRVVKVLRESDPNIARKLDLLSAGDLKPQQPSQHA